MNNLQIKVGGLSCSFYAESIRKAYSRMEGVADMSVSLAHEEALIQYDPEKVSEGELKNTLRQLGYTVRDLDKLKSFEEEEAELREARRKLIVAAVFTASAAVLMVSMWSGAMKPWFRWLTLGLALATLIEFPPKKPRP